MKKLWTVNIFIDGNQGKFTYHSTEPNASVAIAVATKQMFAKWIVTDPKNTRITDVHFKPYEVEDENIISES